MTKQNNMKGHADDLSRTGKTRVAHAALIASNRPYHTGSVFAVKVG
jgi:hypothetical protein